MLQLKIKMTKIMDLKELKLQFNKKIKKVKYIHN